MARMGLSAKYSVVHAMKRSPKASVKANGRSDGMRRVTARAERTVCMNLEVVFPQREVYFRTGTGILSYT